MYRHIKWIQNAKDLLNVWIGLTLVLKRNHAWLNIGGVEEGMGVCTAASSVQNIPVNRIN